MKMRKHYRARHFKEEVELAKQPVQLLYNLLNEFQLIREKQQEGVRILQFGGVFHQTFSQLHRD